DIQGELFILTAENLSLKELLCMIADELKVKKPRYKVGEFIATLAWMSEYLRCLVTRKEPRFTRDDLHVARINFRYNNSKLQLVTGYKFRSMAQSIHETAQLYIESKKKGLDYAV